MSLFTSNWNYLGDQFYKKVEICQMLWNQTINLDEYLIALAPFGGPIALMSNENFYRKFNKNVVSIYSALGDMISAFPVQESYLNLGWSHKEELICINPNGFINMYNLFGEEFDTMTLDQEIRDSKIIGCKIFKSFVGTGIAILTNSLSFYLYNNIHDLKIRRLAEIPNLKSHPVCWDVIANDKDTKLIVSTEEKELYLLKSHDLTCARINPFDDSFDEIVTEISVSFDHSHIAFFTESGRLFLARTTDDISQYLSMFETESKTKPKQLAWCRNDAIAGHWTNLIFFVDLHNNWLKYPAYNTVHMVQEIDSIRVIDDHCQEMITKVDDVTVEIFKIGSWSCGANLLEANRLFEMQSHRVDDYIRLIQEKNEMKQAVNMCLQAAGHEFSVGTQKMLLRAASFGKCFTKDVNPDYFVDMCQKLRILNAIRKANVGIPLTFFQLEKLSIDVLIDRLIERRLFLLALKIAAYLKLSPEQGKIKVLTKWGMFKVRQQTITDDNTAADIVAKIPNHSGVSYAELASKAIELGRKTLAIRLLDHELKSTDQVPLFLKLKQHRTSLEKAIESGDTNLVYQAIFGCRKTMSVSDFLLAIRDYPVSKGLYQKFCKQEDKEQYRNLCFQEDDHVSEAFSYLEQSLEISKQQPASADLATKKNKISLVSSALDTVKRSRNDFLIAHTDEYLRLLRYQLKLEEKFPSTKFFDLSLQATMSRLLRNRETKLCEEMKKEFKVPDKRYYHLKLIALSGIDEWLEIEKMAKAKKSPIGYEPFVDVCLQRHNRFEAQKYLPKIREENKIKYHVKTGNLEDAAKLAFDKKDIEALEYIHSKCGPVNALFQEKVQSMIQHLK